MSDQWELLKNIPERYKKESIPFLAFLGMKNQDVLYYSFTDHENFGGEDVWSNGDICYRSSDILAWLDLPAPPKLPLRA